MLKITEEQLGSGSLYCMVEDLKLEAKRSESVIDVEIQGFRESNRSVVARISWDTDVHELLTQLSSTIKSIIGPCRTFRSTFGY